jgi:hypothetical protein
MKKAIRIPINSSSRNIQENAGFPRAFTINVGNPLSP